MGISIKKSCIIGLDISSSVVGVCFLDANDGSIIKLTHVEFPKKLKNLFDKANYFKKEFIKFSADLVISEIWVEESLQSFRSGFSSAKTLSILSKINALISYVARETHNVEPQYISATSARSTCGIKILSKKHGCLIPAKQQAFTWALNGPLANIVFPKKKTGTYKNYCYDQSDAFIIAQCGFLKTKH
jgi:hypothetical protein